MQSSSDSSTFKLDQRVHSTNDPRRIGTVKYIGPVEGHPGTWVGVDWDNGEAKHDGSLNGVRYFEARSQLSGSFVRAQNLTAGISFIEALYIRYRDQPTQEDEDEMYVLSASNKRVSVELVGKEKIQDKLSRLEELTGASLSYLGVSNPGSPNEIRNILPNLKELDLTGNLLSEWKDVGIICEQLPSLAALNLSSNSMSHEIVGLPLLKNIHILVLNNTGINWTQIEVLKDLLPVIEELHLMGNGINAIKTASSSIVHGFDSLRLLNLEENCIAEWNEIVKLSQLRSLEELHLNKNNLNHIFNPDHDTIDKLVGGDESHDQSCIPFQNLRCLLLGGNNIDDLASVDSLNSFPKLIDIRLSENPIADPGRGGIPRFVLVARLAKVEILNGSEVSTRERKESEIRYVRLVMSKLHGNPDEIKQHPRFVELKNYHGIEDERSSAGTTGPQKMASGLLSVTLKSVGPSIGEKPPLTKKLPAATTIGKLKILCETFFKLGSIRPKLFLQEEGSPLPILLVDEMATLMDVGIGNESTVLVDEES
ncbi:PREDICTED: tubulin-folding cofactor E isoform X1 [Populus euphratica]|uniref:Tubulin-folding cofactor E isoform X1 n=1 Tax=Populus euphratica TaxID=75702 RepID=A0AAJ6XYZ0_POPEU|nr:PREDICTED: tubulin-folding cofactor E isoform X1 [Populus euphratica]XP_011036255.1 PREDICTED: tubulin-folding cofactor E isoform X1 [Populus euphratica]